MVAVDLPPRLRPPDGAAAEGDRNQCPHPVLDPRDLKFYRNRRGYYWSGKTTRSRTATTRRSPCAGLAELLVFSVLLFGSAATVFSVGLANRVTGWSRWCICFLLSTADGAGLLIVWFFRNPQRRIPTGPGTVVSPADGLVVEIEEIEHDEWIGGPAIKVGIFLSIFNVHINRVPVAAGFCNCGTLGQVPECPASGVRGGRTSNWPSTSKRQALPGVA